MPERWLQNGQHRPSKSGKRKRLRFIIQCLIVCLLGLLIGAGLYWVPKKVDINFQDIFNKNIFNKEPEIQEPAPSISSEKVTFRPGEGNEGNFCPICGMDLQHDASSIGRPLALVIDNTGKGRPQSGLLEAGVIYEVPVEGGFTRLLAIYYHGKPGKVGPIRSTRPYFLEIGQEYDAVHVHYGGSDAALKMVSKDEWPSIDGLNNSSIFWRSRLREAPYNLYTSNDRLRDALVKFKFEREANLLPRLFFLPGKGPEEWDNGEALSIHFGKYSKVSYVYDTEKQAYLRFMGDNPHKDADNGEQLAAVNVLVQYVSKEVIDSQERLDLEIIGSGRAMVYTQGHCVEGIWRRSTQDNRTYFLDSSGEEIPLTPGQSWIEIVPLGTKVEG